jgi:serine/threonine-protein kinase HipA
MATSLRVLLGDLPVGTLALDRHDGCEFRLLESYKRAYPRPVLGQAFLDDLDRVHRSRARVPPWFSNLLPEGPLRDLVAQEAGVSPSREFFLLRHLGEDLPGAVRIVADIATGEAEEPDQPVEPGPRRETPDVWHFSLAGVQLKFSARRTGRGLTIPVSGRGGDWIVKLPDGRYPQVPETEYATMRWAEASGISIPEMELVDVVQIDGLPESIGDFRGQRALAVRRFDRSPDGSRVHVEDFAQILGLYPEQKYRRFNYETLANLVRSLSGDTGLDAFVRRLVFVVASGNGDAHHKNWSLLYRNGITAELSPAYDLVATIRYKPDDRMALNLARSKRWEDVDLSVFRRLAEKIGYPEAPLVKLVQGAVEAIANAWHDSGKDFGYDHAARGILSKHMKRIPLFGG